MGHLRDRQLAEMDRALEVGDPGEGRRRGECVCGCAMAIRTGMGTSVCLHSDELVSERPLERAWQSPMTHSLLYLQDDTLTPCSVSRLKAHPKAVISSSHVSYLTFLYSDTRNTNSVFGQHDTLFDA